MKGEASILLCADISSVSLYKSLSEGVWGTEFTCYTKSNLEKLQLLKKNPAVILI